MIRIINQHGVEEVLGSFTFPGGEINVKARDKAQKAIFFLKSSYDIMEMLMYADAYKRTHGVSVNAVVPYLPYARQDRVCNEGEALSIHVMAELINSCKFNSVTMFDPHSHVSEASIQNVNIINQTAVFRGIRACWDDIWIVAPDQGAAVKAETFAKNVGAAGVIKCQKTRDPETGKLRGFKCPEDVVGRKLFVLDDICDGGGTFLGLRTELKDAARVELAVTHGIFSKGLEVVENAFDHVYTTNSFVGTLIKGKRTTCIKIQSLI